MTAATDWAVMNAARLGFVVMVRVIVFLALGLEMTALMTPSLAPLVRWVHPMCRNSHAALKGERSSRRRPR